MPEILFEDNHLIAINKKASELAQGDSSGDEPLDSVIKKYIKDKYKKPGEVFLGVVHRLDRPVSGVILYARTSKALERLNEMFRTRELKKIYWAVVRNKPPFEKGVLEHYLRKNEKQNKSYHFSTEVAGSKKASLQYEIIAESDKYYLIEIELHTGRHHQIRAQLAAAGCPVKGDLKYGAARSNEDGSICLHARSLEFIHPVRKEAVQIIAPPPAGDIWKVFRDIK